MAVQRTSLQLRLACGFLISSIFLGQTGNKCNSVLFLCKNPCECRSVVFRSMTANFGCLTLIKNTAVTAASTNLTYTAMSDASFDHVFYARRRFPQTISFQIRELIWYFSLAWLNVVEIKYPPIAQQMFPAVQYCRTLPPARSGIRWYEYVASSSQHDGSALIFPDSSKSDAAFPDI